jgi:lysyl-tRNA synthetase class II
MLEAYEAFGSWETMADLVEGMICYLAETLFGGLRIVHRQDGGELTTEGTENTEKAQRVINLQRPWRRVKMADLVEEMTGWKFDKRPIQESSPEAARLYFSHILQEFRPGKVGRENPDPDPRHYQVTFQANIQMAVEQLMTTGTLPPNIDRQQVYERAGKEMAMFGRLSPAEQLQRVYEKLIEPALIDPCFVTHVPSVIIPLARKSRDDPFFADVYELAINGQEISPGYSELNDPDVQAANFAHQVGDKEEQQKTDEDFLAALRYGMPPAGGMGLGIDRLVMMLTGAESIRDVILFPLMKPQS